MAVRLSKAIPHRFIFHLVAEPIRLHLALHNIKGVAGEPQRLACQAAVERNLGRGDVFPRNPISFRVRVHHIFKRKEPEAVGLRFPQDRHSFAPIQTAQDTALGGEFADAVQRAGVEARLAMWLGLQPDTNMLDRAGDNAVCHASEGAGKEVLGVGKAPALGFLEVPLLKGAPRVMERAELDGNLHPVSTSGRWNGVAHRLTARESVRRKRCRLPAVGLDLHMRQSRSTG